MEQGEHAGAGDGKQRHGFGKAVDGVAPALPQQQKNGGNQRAGVADTDPPDKIDDGEAPADGDRDAPNADALEEQITDGKQQHHGQAGTGRQSRRTSRVGRGTSSTITDFVRDGGKRVPRLDDRGPCFRPVCRSFVRVLRRRLPGLASLPVQDWDCECRPDTWSGAACSAPPAGCNSVLRLQFGDPAVGIIDIAENNGFGRARLLAGRL